MNIRRDALPEGTAYRDIGCHISPSCLACPLEACIYDDPLAYRKAVVADAVKAAISARDRDHLSYREIADKFGVSLRTIYRWDRWRDSRKYEADLARRRERETAKRKLVLLPA